MNTPSQQSLLQRADYACMLALMALGLLPRLLYFSGFGLGDDIIFRGEVANILISKTVLPDNQAYRFTWWFPTVLSCRVFGLNELGLVFPFTATATLGTGLLYVFGKTLWGRPGAFIAALLLIFHPLDFAWSTMLTNDIMLSFFSALTILLVLRALEHENPTLRRRLWILAAVTLWLAFHAKISALFLMPGIAVICFNRRRRLDPNFFCFIATASILFAGSLMVSYVFTGDPLFAYHAELSFQGLTGPFAKARRITSDVFWYYPRLLFLPNHLGNLLYSLYPHLLLALALAALALRIRTSGAVFWWFLFVFLGMQFNIQREEGVWISGFRNIRHLHVLVYPIILLLAGYLVGLRSRHPRVCHAALGVLLFFSAWQCVSTASKTKVAFRDRRQACHFLATLPRKSIYADQGMNVWCSILDPKDGSLRMQELHPNPEPRKAEIAAIKSGYLVTGGGREPYYGCPHCIPRAGELLPEKWRLVKESAGPAQYAPWRPEPLRIWEAREVSDP